MATSAVAADTQRKFEVEADCGKCQRHRPCYSPGKSDLYVCAECLDDIQGKVIINLQSASYGKFVDEAILGIRSRDESKIILAINAAMDVECWSPSTTMSVMMDKLFADCILCHEFETADARQNFSAPLRRLMKQHRKLFYEMKAEIGKEVGGVSRVSS